MDSFKDHINESKNELHKTITRYAHDVYQNAAWDLPKHGNYHFASAVDHVSDRLYDKFNSHPDLKKGHNFGAIAKRVVRSYTENDNAISKRNEAKAAKAKNPKPPKEKKAPPSYYQRVYGINRSGKPKKGVGSY